MNDKLIEALEQLSQYNVCMCEGGDSYDPLMADYHVLKAREILNEALAASKKEPQAQAEPIVLDSAAEARADREHAEKYYRQAELLLTANERTLHEAIAKKDAALDACVDALESYSKSPYIKKQHPKRHAAGNAAITQAKEARK